MVRCMNATWPILITCARGIPPFLAAEVKALGLTVRNEFLSAVETSGTLDDIMRLNLHLRTGHRVLQELHAFNARSPDEMYKQVNAYPWENVLVPDIELSITSTVEHPSIRDSRYATLKCKDAIVDRMTQACGRRPNTGGDRNGAVVHLFWRNQDARVFIDTAGEPLNRRSYRIVPMDAPMQETLAAACVMASGWDGTTPFVNPMCGSDTLAIEAALVGLRIAPGLLRESFGFMHVQGFKQQAWQKLVNEAKAKVLAKLPVPIIASDLSPAAIRAARQNAQRAGLESSIEFVTCDFRETRIPQPPGVIMMNPAYGERLGDEKDLEPLYKAVGDFFKQSCAGYKGYAFTGNLGLAKKIGLRSSRRITLYNSQIECRLLEFEMYRGTKDPGDAAPASSS